MITFSKIEKASKNLAPKNPLLQYRRLFSEDPLFLHHRFLFLKPINKERKEKIN